MADRFDVCMIGHFARDEIVVQGQSTTSSGGAVYYGAVALARQGLRVAVVTRLARADFAWLDELRQVGIRVYARAAEQTSGIENTYLTPDMDRRLTTPLGFAGPFRLSHVPRIEASLWIVAPIMAGEVDLALLHNLSARGPVALDAQGFVRVRTENSLVFRDWPDKFDGLPWVHYLKVDGAEAEVLTGQTDLLKAARTLAGWGPREIILTHAGGVLVYADGVPHEAPFTPKSLNGRTGRGDTCFAAYLGHRLSHDAATSCRFAARVTSLKLENPGPFRGFAAA